MRLLLALVLLPACAPFTGPCQDADQDGVCDFGGSSACPDRDSDGVCDEDDVCRLGDDAADADEDGIADACDGCPDDPGDDEDGDGACGADDPCPSDADDDCTEKVFVGVQVDTFPEDVTWQLVDHRGSLISSGGFDEAGDGGFFEVEVSPFRQSCLTIRDAGRDGGSRGVVFSRSRGLRYLQWDADDSQSGFSDCFTPEDGQRYTPPTERNWLQDGACDVVIAIATGKNPTTIGWKLEKPVGALSQPGRVVWDAPPGTYSQANRTVEKRLTVTDGEWNLRLLDTAGDGWQSSGDTAAFTVSFANGGEIVSGFLQDGTSGWQSFTVDCG